MVKYKKDNANYEMKEDSANKVLYLTASGFFNDEDGKSFLNDYDKTVKTIPAKDYTLILDAPDLKPSSPDVAGMLIVLLERYIKVPFKKRYFITKGNSITMMQFKRLGSSIPGWTEGVEYVDDYQAALARAKSLK